MASLDLAESDVSRAAGDQAEAAGAARVLAAFAGDLYHPLASRSRNLVLAPISVAAALGMTANGAAGGTAAEIRQVLGVVGLASFNAGLNALTLRLEGLSGPAKRADGSRAELTLEPASSLWGQRDLSWERPFLDVLARHYGAGVHLVDFRRTPDRARRSVNAWTSERTHDRIHEIVPADVVDVLTRLILVNAIYLAAPWEVPFHESATRTGPFRLDDGSTVDVPLMHTMLDHGTYAESDDWQAVRLDYAGRELAMTVVLPRPGRLGDVEASLMRGGLPALLGQVRPQAVDLTLPRWAFSTASALKETLSGLGMPTAFDAEAADFARMTSDERLFVKAVLHDAFIAVDEEGTEAAAATAAVMAATSAPVPVEMVVDRPFLFVVHDTRDLVPLFLGRVADPRA